MDRWKFFAITHADHIVCNPLSSEDDWDRYKGLQWRATERYALAHPDDGDVTEMLERVRAARDRYLRWERDTLGWAT